MQIDEYLDRFGNFRHYFMFDGTDFGLVVEMYRQNPDLMKIGTRVNIINDDPELYRGWPGNDHHWTTETCWNRIIPDLCRDLDVDFNPDDFLCTAYISEKWDVTFHTPKERLGNEFQVVKFEDPQTVKTGCHQDVLRCLYDRDMFSRYQSLFSLWHKCGTIKNLSMKNGRRLLVNGDSEMIPIIPILASYFEEIMYLDNRTETSFSKMIDAYDFTDYVCLMYHRHLCDGTNKILSNLK